jgi:hypothetical protein
MRSKKWNVAKLARAIEHDHSTVSKILAGKRSAGLVVADAIARVTVDWDRGQIRIEEWLAESGGVAHATNVRGTSGTPSSRRSAAA